MPMPVVANPPVKSVITVRSMAMARSVPSRIFGTLGCITVSKVDIGVEHNVGPAWFFVDSAEPSLTTTVDGTLEESLGLGLCGARLLQWVGAISHSERGLSGVILVSSKDLRVVDEKRTSIISALLVPSRESRL